MDNGSERKAASIAAAKVWAFTTHLPDDAFHVFAPDDGQRCHRRIPALTVSSHFHHTTGILVFSHVCDADSMWLVFENKSGTTKRNIMEIALARSYSIGLKISFLSNLAYSFCWDY